MKEKDFQPVSLVDAGKHSSLTEAVEKAMDLVGFDFDQKMDMVAIKPNLCNYSTPTSGETTDPRVVGAIIDILRERGDPGEVLITEADASVMETRYSFHMHGYDTLAQEKGVELVNLTEDEQVPMEVIDVPMGEHIKMPRTLTESDLFITVPKLKLHSLTTMTCALKNQYGCIPFKKKVRFHENVDQVIAHMNRFIETDLVLVDNLVAKGKTPVKLNLIMGGLDPVAVDAVNSKIAGLNPKKVRHIVECVKHSVGSMDYICVGEDCQRFIDAFPAEGFVFNNFIKNLKSGYSLYLKYFTLEGRIFDQAAKKGA